jgi:hypothetical protein
VKSNPGPPMTLGHAAAPHLRLNRIVVAGIAAIRSSPTRSSTRSSRPNDAYGAEAPVLDWRDRLVCSRCGGRQIDIVATGTKRR